ncbi:glycoside hydrolase, partial [Meira miltonrushii]
VIDFMLSNTWNSSQYLAQTNPNIQFVYNATFNEDGQNSTDTQPTIVSINVKERRQYQKMVGLGAGVTDATAIILQALKANRPDAYEEILNLCFNESPEWIAKGGAGMNMIRLPIGASDFGFTEYTYDDTVDGTPDPTLSNFDINKSPKRWQTVQDILKINPGLIVMASPWSPPAWTKGNTRGSLQGGSILQQYEGAFGDYLVKFVKTLKESKGITVKVLSLQNEPLYDGAKYPCSKMLPDQQARIGALTRQKLDAAGFNSVKILAYDHNWDNTEYPIDVFDDAAEDFAGVAWHCYGGDPSGQEPFNEAYPDRWVWFTECTRITQYYEEPWENIKKQFSQIIKGSISYNSQAVILWNLALQIDKEGFTVPSLPQTCRNCLAPIVVYDNSTGPELEGMNRAAIDSQKNRRSLTGPTLNNDNDLFQMFSKRDDAKNLGVLMNAASLSDASAMNQGADNEGSVIPPTRDTNYRTSDYVTLAHLGVAIRPQKDGERWAQRVGVVTSEDDHSGPVVKAQLFRNSLGNGSSRWSVIILQQYDHYGYDRAKAEDITFQLKFRNYVATFVLPPGAFTLQWTAE